MLTGERFDASQALAMGLVHGLAASAGELDATLQPLIDAILLAAPGAIADTKSLLRESGRTSPGPEDQARLARALARRRAEREQRVVHPHRRRRVLEGLQHAGLRPPQPPRAPTFATLLSAVASRCASAPPSANH